MSDARMIVDEEINDFNLLGIDVSIFDRYKIDYDQLTFERELDEGSCAKVNLYKLNGEAVAVKEMLSTSFFENEKIMMQILLEKQASEKQKVHLIQFIGYVEDSLHNWIVMEYMPNGALDYYMAKNKFPIDWNLRIEMMKQVTAALAFLHKN